MTYWCPAQCACCYLSCGPAAPGPEMSVEFALALWESLQSASPHGCRVHLTGGEPFGDWPRLIEVCRRARSQGLGPLQKVETNGYWATDDARTRQRLRELSAAGMQRLAISCDPYHQRFVPLDRVRRLAELAEATLGPAAVQVRWRDWLADGCDTADLSQQHFDSLLRRYLPLGRERLCGRGADLWDLVEPKKGPQLADESCRAPLLRSRHVHVDGDGVVMPGTCAGISLGRFVPGRVSIAGLWRQLELDHASRPVLGALVAGGPRRLAAMAAVGEGPAPRPTGGCSLCWLARRQLAAAGSPGCGGELSPDWMYQR